MGVRKIKTKQNERNSSRNHAEKKLDTTIENVCLKCSRNLSSRNNMPRSREYSVDSFTHSVLKPKRVLMERAGGLYCKAVSNVIVGAGSLGVTSSHLWCWWRGTDQYLAALFTRTASWVLKWFFSSSFFPSPT